MKNITLQLNDYKGNVIKENNLTINDGDVLIMKYPDNLTPKSASDMFEFINTALKENRELIAIPECIELQVLSKC